MLCAGVKRACRSSLVGCQAEEVNARYAQIYGTWTELEQLIDAREVALEKEHQVCV